MKTIDLSGLTEKDRTRFWSKVDIRNGCWNWLGRKVGKGYGKFTIGNKSVKAHRVSFEICVAHIPDGLCVLHTCDNRVCCNPSHLFKGTKADNNLDMWAKGNGKTLKGEQSNLSVFTDEEVAEIRFRYHLGKTQIELAREFRVTSGAIWKIVHRKSWAHVL